MLNRKAYAKDICIPIVTHVFSWTESHVAQAGLKLSMQGRDDLNLFTFINYVYMGQVYSRVISGDWVCPPFIWVLGPELRSVGFGAGKAAVLTKPSCYANNELIFFPPLECWDCRPSPLWPATSAVRGVGACLVHTLAAQPHFQPLRVLIVLVFSASCCLKSD